MDNATPLHMRKLYQSSAMLMADVCFAPDERCRTVYSPQAENPGRAHNTICQLTLKLHLPAVFHVRYSLYNILSMCAQGCSRLMGI